MNKTYKTLDGAYARADKLGAKNFCADYYGYEHRVREALDKNFTTAPARRLATHNLAKLDKTLYALECTKEGVYKWTAIGHFDHEGLLYPMSATKVVEDKPKTLKRKPVHAKGDNKPVAKTALQRELDTLAGTGDNSAAHKIMCKHGLKNSKSDEYQKVWRGYWHTIR